MGILANGVSDWGTLTDTRKCRNGSLHWFLLGTSNSTTTVEKSGSSIKNLKMQLPHDAAILLLGLHTQRLAHKCSEHYSQWPREGAVLGSIEMNKQGKRNMFTYGPRPSKGGSCTCFSENGLETMMLSEKCPSGKESD